jgi:hypothetical protein
MALGQYIAGMGFSNVGLGIVHSMAHGLSALYDTPHGIACAIILPTVLDYNADYTGEKYRAGQGHGRRGRGQDDAARVPQGRRRRRAQLGQDVGIPQNLKGIVKDEDVQFLSESAFADACRPGNPRDTSVEEIAALYRSLHVIPEKYLKSRKNACKSRRRSSRLRLVFCPVRSCPHPRNGMHPQGRLFLPVRRTPRLFGTVKTVPYGRCKFPHVPRRGGS